jgi:AcrR family transcriptional regulator
VAGQTKAPRVSAREKLLAAADELFYAHGIQSVGIDRIIEHAGVAKGSLYNTFGSKDELVRAYLASRHAGTTDRLGRAVEAETDPRQRLLAVFRAQAELFREPGFRGCAFVTASAEAPEGGVVERAADQYRADIRTLFARLARELAARMDRNPDVARASLATVEALIGSAL